jgi:hypothetical protein
MDVGNDNGDVHETPLPVWQLPQVLLVMGATECELIPPEGAAVACTPS